jgi:hypothetical protein
MRAFIFIRQNAIFNFRKFIATSMLGCEGDFLAIVQVTVWSGMTPENKKTMEGISKIFGEMA